MDLLAEVATVAMDELSDDSGSKPVSSSSLVDLSILSSIQVSSEIQILSSTAGALSVSLPSAVTGLESIGNSYGGGLGTTSCEQVSEEEEEVSSARQEQACAPHREAGPSLLQTMRDAAARVSPASHPSTSPSSDTSSGPLTAMAHRPSLRQVQTTRLVPAKRASPEPVHAVDPPVAAAPRSCKLTSNGPSRRVMATPPGALRAATPPAIMPHKRAQDAADCPSSANPADVACPGGTPDATSAMAGTARRVAAEVSTSTPASMPAAATLEDQPGPSQPAPPLAPLLAITLPWRHIIDPADQAFMDSILCTYRAKFEELRHAKQVKPDTKANAILKSTLRPQPYYGHPKGVHIGQRFNDRGDLAILGIHVKIFNGIDWPLLGKEKKLVQPAYAIALSGGYADDKDEGLSLEYTGMGGRNPPADQTWTQGNEALRQNYRENMPVRVVRGASCQYVYEGLYYITEDPRMEVGSNGKLVCKFRLQGVPGHSIATMKVVHKGFSGAFRRVILAPADESRRPKQSKKGKTVSIVDPEEVLLDSDIAKGQELVPIPAYKPRGSTARLPADWEYVRCSMGGCDEVAAMTSGGAAATQFNQDDCGLARMQGQTAYNELGHLCTTSRLPIYECSEACQGRLCGINRQVSRGVRLPLQVFFTGSGRGWGVRCARDLRPGQFVCEYAGALLTDDQAEASGDDSYLFNLDHFVLLAAALKQGPTPDDDLEDVLDQALPAGMPEVDEDGTAHNRFLTINARHKGNVGRFINHSCSGNLVKQVVFMPGCSPVCYRLALFVMKFIPAGTELTYDYGYVEDSISGRELQCKCGEPDCRKRLL